MGEEAGEGREGRRGRDRRRREEEEGKVESRPHGHKSAPMV